MRFEALDLALALHAQPQRADEARARALPAGVTEVLRIALAHDATLTAAVAATGLPSQQLSDAARFFVEQQILARECQDDPWRTLGVATGADIGQIREHHRLLVRLVHPDRSDEWASAFADRVNKAWRQLREESGRAGALAAVADSDAEFGQRRDVRTPPPNPVDAWAMRTTPPLSRPEPAQVLDPAPQQASYRPRPLFAIAAVAMVAIAVGAGFWLGLNQGQQAASAPSTIDPPAMAPPRIAETEAPKPSEPPIEPESPEVIETAPADLPPMPAPMVAKVREHIPPAPIRTAAVELPPPRPARHPAQRPMPTSLASKAPPSTSNRASAAVASVEPSATAVVAHPMAESAAAREHRVQSPVDVPAAVPASNAPTRADAQALLDVYIRRYADGDLGGMLGLFAREVHAEDRRVAAIAQQYSRLFAATSDRVIALRDLRWQRDGERVYGSGQYQTRYRPNNKLRHETISGRIEFEVINDGGNSRLLRLSTTPGQRS